MGLTLGVTPHTAWRGRGGVGTPQHHLARDGQEKGDPENQLGDFGGDGKAPPRGAVGQSQTPPGLGNGGSGPNLPGTPIPTETPLSPPNPS